MISAGIRIAPIANVVATLEPDTAAKIMQVSTQVAASPPWRPPTIDLANSTSRCEMPPDSIRLPARMKNGIAASGNLLMAPNISLTIASRLRFACQAPTRLARPIDTATEMLSAKHSTIVRNIVDGIGFRGTAGRIGGWLLRRFELVPARVDEAADDAQDAEDPADRATPGTPRSSTATRAR